MRQNICLEATYKKKISEKKWINKQENIWSKFVVNLTRVKWRRILRILVDHMKVTKFRTSSKQHKKIMFGAVSNKYIIVN